jgi:uncharacterized protein
MQKFVYILFFLLLASCSRIETSGGAYPADGVSGGAVEIQGLFSDEFLPPRDPDPAVIEIILFSPHKINFKSAGKEGQVVFSTKKGSKIALTFYKITLDSDADGYVDASELSHQRDRDALRSWMVRIAESQFLKISPAWDERQRDCAGLVRFCFREALRKHDAAWNRKTGIVLDKNIADVGSFNYPDIPVIGENIFKISDAPYDNKNSFSSFADGGTLVLHSMRRVGNSIEDALPGDCAVFENRRNAEWPFHIMIICNTEGRGRILIYHTGDAQGIKRINLSYLNSSIDFKPADSNPKFLGVYRFKMME